MYRDFSENSYNTLLQMVSDVENEKLHDLTDWFGDRWYDFQSWIGVLNIKNYIDNVNEYHRKVIDKNNTTKDTIGRIFNAVTNLDGRYSTILQQNNTQFGIIKRYMEELCQLVNPSNGCFRGEFISDSMAELSELLTESMEYFTAPTEEVCPKLLGVDFTGIFIDSRNTDLDAIAVGWTANWIENMTSLLFDIGDDVNETIVKKSILELISQVLDNKHVASDFTQEYTKALKPEEFKIGEKIIGLTLDLGEDITEAKIAEILEIDIKDITESDYLKWLCQSENLQFIQSMTKDVESTLGAYSDAVDIYDISTQMITKVFNDYTEDVKYLEAIKKALIDGGYDNETVNKVVDSLLWEYRNQYISAAHDGIEKLAQMGIDKGIDKALPLLDLFIDTKDISSSVIGLTDTTDNIGSVYSTQQYSYGLVEKYEYYRNKVNSGDYSNYDAEQCRTYFELAKAAKIQEYKAIITVMENALDSVSAIFASSEDKQCTRDMIAKIEEEIERLEDLTLNI